MLYTDASQKGFGWTLSQKVEGKENIIEFAGKCINHRTSILPSSRLECESLVQGVRYFDKYLAGSKFEVITDNIALVYIFGGKRATVKKFERYQLELSTYDFTIRHMPGRLLYNADIASRIDHDMIEKDMREHPPNGVVRSINALLHNTTKPFDPSNISEMKEAMNTYAKLSDNVRKEDVDALKYVQTEQMARECMAMEKNHILKRLQITDDLCSLIRRCIKLNKKIAEPQSDTEKQANHLVKKCFIKDDILYVTKTDQSQQTTLILAPKSMRLKILSATHCDSIHYGALKTLKKIMETFFWPNISEDVNAFVKGCEVCAAFKPSSRPDKPWNSNYSTDLSRPFEVCQCDLYGPLDASFGFIYVIVWMDILTKFAIIKNLKSATTQAIADSLFDDVVPYFGYPRVIHSDNASSFHSALATIICERVNITKVFSSPYHPQSLGSCERVNYSIALGLFATSRQHRNRWSKFTGNIMLCHNTSYNESIRMTPQRAAMGYTSPIPEVIAWDIPENVSGNDRPYLATVDDRFESLRELARLHNSNYLKKLNDKHDQKVKPHPFKSGDLVFLKLASSLKTAHMKPRFSGPLVAKDVTLHHATLFNLDGTIHGTVSVDNLKPFKEFNKDYDNDQIQKIENENPIFNNDPNMSRHIQSSALNPETCEKSATVDQQKPSDAQYHNTSPYQFSGNILNHHWNTDGLVLQVQDENGSFWIPSSAVRNDILEAYMSDKTSHGYFTRSKLCMTNMLKIALLFLLFCCARARPERRIQSDSIDLGDLYLCNETSNLGLFSFPHIDICGDKMAHEPTKLTGRVFRYAKRRAYVDMYICTYKVVSATCYETVFGALRHKMLREELKVTPKTCQLAIETLVSPHRHPIKRINDNFWRTSLEIDENCKWLESNKLDNFEFFISKKRGFIETNDSLVHNDLTATRCFKQRGSCIPREDPLAVIIYPHLPALPNAYTDLGVHKTIISNNLAFIATLGEGSVVVKRTKNALFLYDGLIIQINSTAKIKLMDESYKLFGIWADKNSYKATEIMTSHVARTFAVLTSRIHSLEKMLCLNKKETLSLKLQLINRLKLHDIVTAKKGVKLVPAGDGFHLYGCRPISSYKRYDKRFYFQKRNNTFKKICTQNLPVLISEKMYFVDIQTRTLSPIPKLRNCSRLPPVLLIKDKHGRLLKLLPRGIWFTARSNNFLINASMPFERIHSFNKALSYPSRLDIPKEALMSSLQETYGFMSSLSHVDRTTQDHLSSLLTDDETLNALTELKKYSAKLIKDVKRPFKEKAIEFLENLAIYFVAPLASLFSLYLTYRISKCLIRRRRRRQLPVVKHIVVRHSDIMEDANEPTGWITNASAPLESPKSLKLIKSPRNSQKNSPVNPPPAYADAWTHSGQKSCLKSGKNSRDNVKESGVSFY